MPPHLSASVREQMGRLGAEIAAAKDDPSRLVAKHLISHITLRRALNRGVGMLS